MTGVGFGRENRRRQAAVDRWGWASATVGRAGRLPATGHRWLVAGRESEIRERDESMCVCLVLSRRRGSELAM